MGVKKKSRPQCLVLYPEELEANYVEVYSVAIQRAHLDAVTVAKILTTSARITKVRDIIDHADFVIADVSGRDKDVLFRAGLAQALGKPVGIVAQRVEDIPSDLQHVGYAVYDVRKPRWATDLQKDIIVLISEALGAR